MPLRRHLVAAGVAVLALSGCTSESHLRELNEAAGPEDALPSYVRSENLDPESVRLVGERDGIRVYLARSVDRDGSCLVIDAGGEDWTAGCGYPVGGAGLHGVGDFVVAHRGERGYEQLSDSVWVRWE